MNEISFSFLSRVHIWSTYSTKIHLAANEIIFRVIRGYKRTVRILVISNLCTYLAIIWSFICAINIWNSFTIAFNLLDKDYNIPTIKNVHKISYQKGKRLRRDITFWMRLYSVSVSSSLSGLLSIVFGSFWFASLFLQVSSLVWKVIISHILYLLHERERMKSLFCNFVNWNISWKCIISLVWINK